MIPVPIPNCFSLLFPPASTVPSALTKNIDTVLSFARYRWVISDKIGACDAGDEVDKVDEVEVDEGNSFKYTGKTLSDAEYDDFMTVKLSSIFPDARTFPEFSRNNEISYEVATCLIFCKYSSRVFITYSG